MLHYLGLETGGTKAVAVVFDADRRVRGAKEAPRPANANARDTVAQLIALGRGVQLEAGIKAAPQAVGWGFGGPVDRKRNRPAVNFHEPGWAELEPAATATLAEALGAPVFVENDCKVAGLAEAHLGAGTTEGLTFYMTLGSGVGGGLIWNGRILDSGPFGEGEIGHMKVVRGGATCACGQRGCLEAYCSGWGVGERVTEAIAAAMAPDAFMQSLLAVEPRQRAALLFNAWPKEAFAREQVTAFLEHLAEACSTVGMLLAPRRLVLGGGIAKQPWLVTELAPRIEQRLPKLMRGHMEVKSAQLGALSVPCGAALYASLRMAET